MLNIISLPAEYKYFTLEAIDKINEADIVIVQTNKTPTYDRIADEAKNIETLDKFFEEAQSFDELYAVGADYITEITKDKDAVFCILGEPSQNGFVEKLKGKTSLNYIYGGSVAGLAAFYGSVEFNDSGVYTATDARQLSELQIDTSKLVIITGIEDNMLLEDVKLFLQEYYDDETLVLLISGDKIAKVKLGELSDLGEYGAGAAIVAGAQPLLNKKKYGFNDLLTVMKILRAPDGCPWDAEQTHNSLKPYLLEESYEVMDAVDKDDMFALYDELGDVLLQVVFHSEIARQCKEFEISDVTTAICSKLIGRHPHIFGEVPVNGADEVVSNWEEIKRGEKGFESVSQSLYDIPQNMGALMRAAKIQKKAAAVGFDWDTAAQALEKVKEETFELRSELARGNREKIEKEGGDLLFAVVNVLRKCKVNPELALRGTSEKFIKRFSYIEENADKPLKEMSLGEMDALWERAKESEEN